MYLMKDCLQIMYDRGFLAYLKKVAVLLIILILGNLTAYGQDSLSVEGIIVTSPASAGKIQGEIFAISTDPFRGKVDEKYVIVPDK